MKVFVVEDNPVYCKYVCNLLAREGFETETASSLSAARKLADKMESEDIILADLRLPDGECTGLLKNYTPYGIQFTHRIKVAVPCG